MRLKIIHVRALFCLVLATVGNFALAIQLPTNLSQNDFTQIADYLGVNSTGRLLRSAEGYPNFPGVRIGLEVALVPLSQLQGIGANNGSIPNVLPTPRLHLAKGIGMGFEVIGFFCPSTVYGSNATWGGFLKYEWLEETEHSVSLAAYGGFTKVDAISGAFRSYNFETGLFGSKDFVVFKPYLGFGIIHAKASIDSAYLQPQVADTTSRWKLHSFFGGEIETIANVTFQVEFFDLNPAGSVMVGKRF